MSDRALITLAIGGDYLANWKRYCEPGWTKYAQRHGLDVVVITEPVVESTRSPAWQKCLIPERAKKYHRIALLDADIAINPEAPSIFEQTTEDKVGGVISGSHIHPDFQAMLVENIYRITVPYEESAAAIEKHKRLIYDVGGLPYHPEGMIQTGVLTLTPELHAPIFQQAYAYQVPETRTYEQAPLSHALLSAGVFKQIDTRFNSVFVETLWIYHKYLFNVDFGGEHVTQAVVRAEFANNFFLHFAYYQWMLKYLSD
jgi:hypothetical protein